MTNEEAIEELYRISNIVSSWAFEQNGYAHSDGPQMATSIKMAIDALEGKDDLEINRKPKKVRSHRNTADRRIEWSCPACKESLNFVMTQAWCNFCPNCGQPLDWDWEEVTK